MNAIDVLGNVAGGIMEGQEEIRKQRAADTAIETQKLQQKALEYDMIEKEKERQMLDSYVPLKSVWPDWQENPSTMKMFGNVLGKSGMADQVIKQKDDVYITNRALKHWQGIMQTNASIAEGLSKAKLRDLDTKYNDLALKVSTGQMSDGTKIKDDDLNVLKDQMEKIAKAKSMIFTASNEYKLKMAEAKEKMKAELNASWEPYGREPNGTQVFYNKKVPGKYINERGDFVTPTKGIKLLKELPTTSVQIHNPAPYIDKDKEAFNNMSTEDRKKYGVNSYGDFLKWKANLKDKEKEEDIWGK